MSSLPLRICCYGSSSSRTPKKYTDAAYELGLALARRGHTCVNGAGTSGCMAAMNEGASSGGGNIVGVIHEMFVVDGSDWAEGSHPVFSKGNHEMLVATGGNLQERKRLLAEGADAFVVLPGGPGTWDELWEMACARHIDMINVPIVCINIDGYYDSFMSILQRAHDEGLLYKHPHEIIHFENTPGDALEWVERHSIKSEKKQLPSTLKRRTSILKRMESNVSLSVFSMWGKAASFFGNDTAGEGLDTQSSETKFLQSLALFMAGVSVGVMVSSKLNWKS